MNAFILSAVAFIAPLFYLTSLKKSKSGSFWNRSCALEIAIFIFSIISTLWIWRNTGEYCDSVFMLLCSVAVLTLFLRGYSQQRPLTTIEWHILKIAVIISSTFWFYCGYALMEPLFLEYIFGFLVFQWFIYIASLLMNVVFSKRKNALRGNILTLTPLYIAIYIAFLKLQFLELDALEQLFFFSWIDLIFSLSGSITIATSVGVAVLLTYVIHILSDSKITLSRIIVVLLLLLALCALIPPRFMLFPLCSLPGFSLCFFQSLKYKTNNLLNQKKKCAWVGGALFFIMLGLVVGDGFPLIPMGGLIILNGVILFQNSSSEFLEGKNKVIYTSLFSCSIFALAWTTILVIEGAEGHQVDVEVSLTKDSDFNLASFPSINLPSKLSINIQHKSVTPSELEFGHYQYIHVAFITPIQQQELLKLGYEAPNNEYTDYYQKWSRNVLRFKDLSFGESAKSCPAEYRPNRKSTVRIAENTWLDKASSLVYQISPIR